MSLVKTCENDNRIARPTPLYFMDEIDAALDFRNVSIIANYIKAICWTSRPSVLSCTSCRCSVWMPLKSTWCLVREPSSHEDHWIQSKFIDSTTWIQYSRLYSGHRPEQAFAALLKWTPSLIPGWFVACHQHHKHHPSDWVVNKSKDEFRMATSFHHSTPKRFEGANQKCAVHCDLSS